MSTKLTEIARTLHKISNNLDKLKTEITSAALTSSWAEAELQAAVQKKQESAKSSLQQTERFNKYIGSLFRTWAHWCLLNETSNPSDWPYYEDIPPKMRRLAMQRLAYHTINDQPVAQFTGEAAVKIIRQYAGCCERGDFV